MIYDIKDLNGLITSSEQLTKCSQTIASDINSLNYIKNSLQKAWQNEQGSDLNSILTELTSCISELETSIQPTIQKFATTIEKIANDTANAQGRTL